MKDEGTVNDDEALLNQVAAIYRGLSPEAQRFLERVLQFEREQLYLPAEKTGAKEKFVGYLEGIVK